MHVAYIAMNTVKKTITFLLLIPFLCIFSCRKNSGPSWDTQILAPLIKTSLSIGNLITNTNSVTNPDSSVTLVFHDSLYSLNIDSLFKIRDTTLADIYPGIPGLPLSPGGSIIPGGGTPSQTTYNLGSVNLTKAIVQTGFVKFKVISTLPRVTDYTYAVQSATYNGNQLAINIQVPATTGSIKRQERDTILPLSGYTVDFTGLSHNGYNTLVTVLNGILDPSAPAYTLTSNDSVIITAQFYGIVPEYGQGYFGKTQKTIGPTQLSFPLFSGIKAGSLKLKDANVTFTLENGFGVDARVYINSLTAINTRPGGINVPLNASIINNAININGATATINPSAPVIPSVQTFSLTSSNSNIVNWIDNLPTAINYQLQLSTNPLGWTGNSNFAYYGYGIKAYLDVSVPLNLATNNLTLEDTVPVNFASSGQAQQIKSGTFTLYASNLFPFSAGMQIYLLDNNKNVADSILIPVQTIAAGIPNSYGFVANPAHSVLAIPLDTYHANLLFSSKNIIIKAIFNMGCTTCPTYVKIYNTYQLNLKLIGNFDYQVKG